MLVIAPAFVHANTVSPDLLQRLDDILEEKEAQTAGRLELIAEIDQQLGNSAGFDSEIWIKARQAEAIARLRLGELQAALDISTSLQDNIDRKRFPLLAFRAGSLQAALLQIVGRNEDSVAAFEALLSNPPEGVPVYLINRARINYGTALNSAGRAKLAATQLEQVMLDALASGNEVSALHAGGNLTALLIDERDLPAARKTLNYLKPVYTKRTDRISALSLQRHEYELLRREGKTNEAIAGFERIIGNPDVWPALLQGGARLGLASAWLDLDEPGKAIQFANEALEYMGQRSGDRNKTYYVIAEAEIKRGRYEAALDALSKIDEAGDGRLNFRVRRDYLSLSAKLRMREQNDLAEALDQLMQAEHARDQAASTDRQAYFEARLSALEQSRARERAEQEIEALRLSADAEKSTSRLWMLVIIGTGLMSLFAIVSVMSRKQTKAALAMKESQNEELERLVAAKAAELEANLREREAMHHALERRKRVEEVAGFAGEVAHKVNNILQVVASANDTLASSDTTPEIRNSIIQASNSSVGHGRDMIDRLLTLAKQEDISIQTRTTAGTPAGISLLSEQRLLMVEDDSIVGETLLPMLKKMVADVVWLYTADDAKAHIESGERFDIVLSDIRMPGALNGVSLIEWLQETHPDMRLGLMSGYSDVDASATGVPIIPKPFTLAELQEFLAYELWSGRSAAPPAFQPETRRH